MLAFEFYQSARNSLSLRDEDISFPPTLDRLSKLPLKDILSGLQAAIDGLQDVRVIGHFKVIRALLLLTLNTVNREYLLSEGLKHL